MTKRTSLNSPQPSLWLGSVARRGERDVLFYFEAAMTNPLTIKNWDTLFENNESRKLVHLRWIPIPNKHDGMGYGQLWQHKRAADIFAAWILILQIASRCEPRGTLINKDGKPITPLELSVKTRAPIEIFETAIPALIEIGWMSGESPEAPGESGRSPEGKGREQKGMEKNTPVGVALDLSARLLAAIQKRNPNHRKPDLTSWAKHIDLMIRVDKRDPAQIAKVIDWCQADTAELQPAGKWKGWANNILSTATLREKYDKLVLKMNEQKTKPQAPQEIYHKFIEPISKEVKEKWERENT